MTRPRPKALTLTDAAAARMKEIMDAADEDYIGVSIGVKNGGCAGMEYTMEYATEQGPLDEVVEDNGDQNSDRSESDPVPVGFGNRFCDRKAFAALRLQQPQPDRRLRLRRERDVDASRNVTGQF